MMRIKMAVGLLAVLPVGLLTPATPAAHAQCLGQDLYRRIDDQQRLAGDLRRFWVDVNRGNWPAANMDRAWIVQDRRNIFHDNNMIRGDLLRPYQPYQPVVPYYQPLPYCPSAPYCPPAPYYSPMPYFGP
jgi:hypothetical protein